MKGKLILGLTLCVSSVHASQYWEAGKDALYGVGAGVVTYAGSAALTSLSAKQRAAAAAIVAICVGLGRYAYHHRVSNQLRVTDVITPPAEDPIPKKPFTPKSGDPFISPGLSPDSEKPGPVKKPKPEKIVVLSSSSSDSEELEPAAKPNKNISETQKGVNPKKQRVETSSDSDDENGLPGLATMNKYSKPSIRNSGTVRPKPQVQHELSELVLNQIKSVAQQNDGVFYVGVRPDGSDQPGLQISFDDFQALQFCKIQIKLIDDEDDETRSLKDIFNEKVIKIKISEDDLPINLSPYSALQTVIITKKSGGRKDADLKTQITLSGNANVEWKSTKKQLTAEIQSNAMNLSLFMSGPFH